MKMSAASTGLLAVALVVMPHFAAAQFPPPPPAGSPPPVRDRWPEPQRQQAEPIQQPEQKPAPARRPPSQARPKPDADGATSKDASSQDSQPKQAPSKQAAKPAPPRTSANVIACSGVFAKESTHLKLALKYDSRNLAYGPVDGPDGSKINASVLFPNDPKRRLEVLWNNEAGRADTSVIAINGRSQWVAPKGLKLGLPLAAIEKSNGKPFKLTGFGADGTASIVTWDGGGLATLPGGCKVGMRVALDAKAPEEARTAVAGEKEFLSNDPAVRAVRPTVMEILIGY